MRGCQELSRMCRRLSALMICVVPLSLPAGCSGGASGFAGGIPHHPDKISLPSLEFHPERPEVWTHANGMRVHFQRDDELPVVGVQLYFRGGSLREDLHEAGIFSTTVSQMREGSVEGLSPDELDARLDRLAASIEARAGGEYGSVSAFSLKEDFPEVFELFSRVVRTPQFNQKRLSLAQSIALDAIKRRRDNPGTMGGMSLSRFVFGENSPYSAHATRASIQGFSQKRLREVHQKFVRPENAIFTIGGDISREEAEALIDRYFGNWTGPSDASLPELPTAVRSDTKPGIYVLEREFDQVTLLLGHQGPPRITDDMFARVLFNRAFSSSGFDSLLIREIRTKRGLAYSVYGGVYGGARVGEFQVYAGTRADQVLVALEQILKLVHSVTTEPIESDAIDLARQAALASYVFKFDTSAERLDRSAILELLGFPEDYDERYVEAVAAASYEEVFEIGQTWIHPDELVVVLVGNVKVEEVVNQFGSDFDVYRLDFDTSARVVERFPRADRASNSLALQ